MYTKYFMPYIEKSNQPENTEEDLKGSNRFDFLQMPASIDFIQPKNIEDKIFDLMKTKKPLEIKPNDPLNSGQRLITFKNFRSAKIPSIIPESLEYICTICGKPFEECNLKVNKIVWCQDCDNNFSLYPTMIFEFNKTNKFKCPLCENIFTIPNSEKKQISPYSCSSSKFDLKKFYPRFKNPIEYGKLTTFKHRNLIEKGDQIDLYNLKFGCWFCKTPVLYNGQLGLQLECNNEFCVIKTYNMLPWSKNEKNKCPYCDCKNSILAKNSDVVRVYKMCNENFYYHTQPKSKNCVSSKHKHDK